MTYYQGVVGNNQPAVLYHYCSLDTFTHIVQDKTLWLSDITKSNDSLEMAWYQRFCTKKIIEIWNDYLKKSGQELLKTGYRTRFEGIIARSKEIEINSPLYVWALCLSSLEDDLSQWRGYGNDGRGVSVGFNTEKLGLFAYSKGCSIPTFMGVHEVKYDEIEMENCFDVWMTKETITAQTSLNEVLNRLNYIVTNAPRLAYEYKNSSFAKEKEWRIVLYYSKDEMCSIQGFDNNYGIKYEKIDFIEKDNGLVSHIVVKIPKMMEFITSVTIGPKSRTTPEDIRSFLLVNGFLDNININRIKVTKSISSYR